MLETLVSSRIRRTLFEYILSHPTERFYLRGLAKDLGLSVSPLRRELKRLERSGMLRAEAEGNILFYRVNPQAPVFLQLQQVSRPTTPVAAVSPDTTARPAFFEAEGGVSVGRQEGLPVTTQMVQAGKRTKAPSPSSPHSESLGAGRSVSETPTFSPRPTPHVPRPESIPLGVLSVSQPSRWSSPMSNAMLLGAAAVGMGLMLIIVALAYLTMTDQRITSRAPSALNAPQAAMTAVPPDPSSGVMRGSRWQIVPGGFGGFSSGTSHERY